MRKWWRGLPLRQRRELRGVAIACAVLCAALPGALLAVWAAADSYSPVRRKATEARALAQGVGTMGAAPARSKGDQVADGQTAVGHAVRQALTGRAHDVIIGRAVHAADASHRAETSRLCRALEQALPDRFEDWHGSDPVTFEYLRTIRDRSCSAP